MQLYRQGDVLIFRCKKPSGVELAPIPLEGGQVILGRGEVTGHSHALDGRLAEFAVNEQTAARYLRVRAPATLRHEEHRALDLPTGWYEVRIQREYERGAVRNVAD